MRLDRGQIEVVDEPLAEVLRRKTGAERLAIANDLFVSARRMIQGFLRSQHPDWSEQTINQEAARRLSHGSF